MESKRGAWGSKHVRSETRKAKEERQVQRAAQRRQAVQLAVCLALFLTVFISKGVFPQKIGQVGEKLVSVIRLNADFRGAFTRLGQALKQQDATVLEELGAFCAAVFAAKQPEMEEIAVLQPRPDSATVSDRGGDEKPAQSPVDEQTQVSAPDQTEPEAPAQQTEPIVETETLEVGDIVQAVSYQGEPLPAHYTMQWLYLGDMETVTPVFGTITSSFGYRDHPTVQRYALHGGVDIAANEGSPVAAFAAGRVEYIGESDDFGLYLQIEHENGVKTFYAHCSRLYVAKGQTVSAGEVVAQVGSTGQSTGPHLHFEVKYDGARLNPEYYIDVSKGA